MIRRVQGQDATAASIAKCLGEATTVTGIELVAAMIPVTVPGRAACWMWARRTRDQVDGKRWPKQSYVVYWTGFVRLFGRSKDWGILGI